VVFMTGLVDAASRPGPGASRSVSLLTSKGKSCQRVTLTVQEERRLFYVGMTRARDELVLSHVRPTTVGGGPAVCRSSCGSARPARNAASRCRCRRCGPLSLERLAAFEPVAEPVERGRQPGEGPLSLSFYQVGDYLTCRSSTSTCTVLRRADCAAPLHRVRLRSAPGVQEFHPPRGARGAS